VRVSRGGRSRPPAVLFHCELVCCGESAGSMRSMRMGGDGGGDWDSGDAERGANGGLKGWNAVAEEPPLLRAMGGGRFVVCVRVLLTFCCLSVLAVA
jgi:hypothetical protein